MARRTLIAAAVLALLVLAAFLPTAGNGFIELHDDTLYVTQNAHVLAGLTRAGLAWALTSTEALNWHPLTWISHMLDVQLFGLVPRGHHLVSVAWHVGNTLLLFALLRAMTGAFWRPAFVAALFGVHPLHVESVAWVAERKDVLSTFFGFLTIGAYLRYARSPSVARYLPALAAFALGLTAKSMLVTLPILLLLLDFWPLGRIARRPAPGAVASHAGAMTLRQAAAGKIPLFLLAGAAGAMTFLAQSRGGVVRSWMTFPLPVRLGNAAVSYIRYLGKMIWPRDLAFFYPHPLQGLPAWQVAGAVVLLAAATALALHSAGRRPWLGVGWLWYLVTLLPVIGLVQLGSQAMADRYTYVPLIGIFVAIAWEASDLARGAPRRQAALAASGAAVLALLLPLTRAQVSYWKDSATLFRHSLAAGGEDWLLRNNLGLVYAGQGRLDEAMVEYAQAMALDPEALFPRVNMGVALAGQGRLREAIGFFETARSLQPLNPEVHINLGIAQERLGNFDEAARSYREALRLRPGDVNAGRGLGRVLARLGREGR